MENNAVCRCNQHRLYYALKLGKQNTTRGLDTPARAIQGKPSTYTPQRTLGGQKSAQEIWVGTKVGYGCQALLLAP